jgi:hypothetical protein
VECGGICDVITTHKFTKLNEYVLYMLDEAVLSGTKLKVVFKDGKKSVVKKRKKARHEGTPDQKRAIANARRFAHTPTAKMKRRKSVLARKDAGLVGDV